MVVTTRLNIALRGSFPIVALGLPEHYGGTFGSRTDPEKNEIY